jgi:hypothetical protein
MAWCETEDACYILEGAGEGLDRDTLLQTAAAVIPTSEEE